LLGEASPSGRLPVTFPRRLEDNPAYGFYPGGDSVAYGEGLGVGYRHYDMKGIEPLFPFGHGLTSSTFDYADLAAPQSARAGDDVAVSFTLANTGQRTAAEVAQLYVGPLAPKVPTPPKALKGFAKVELKPGERRTVTLTLNARAFARYDEAAGDWVIDPGVYALLLGASATDIRLTGQVTLA
jgi:beta-glucosidase